MNKLKYDYTILTPFKLCVLENFPFIEADFDALTNYQIMCKMVEYMNSISKNQNLVQTNMIELNNWFNNLDVQDEINNKLDSMAKSGELQEIIESYLNSNCIVAFNTLTDLKNGENLIEGSFACSYGKNSLNDGYGAFYKIRTITSSDVVDNDKIVALNTSNTLIAEKITFAAENKRKYIFIGDSYGTGQNELGEQTTPWTTLVPQYLGLSESDYFTDSSNGSGFKHGYLFLNQLKRVEENINDKDSITDIIIVGGYNDQYNTVEENITAIQEFCEYAKTKFKNALVSISCVGWSKVYDSRQAIATRTIPAYTKCGQFGARYLLNTEFILHDYSLFSNDSYHPNQNGQNELSSYLVDAIINGSCNVIRGFVTPTTEKYDENLSINPTYILEMQNNNNITLVINPDFIQLPEERALGRNDVINLLKFTDGLIFGGGIPCFCQHTMVFGANTNASTLYDIPCIFSVDYDRTNNCGTFKLIVDRTKNTFSNVKALSVSQIQITFPALYS